MHRRFFALLLAAAALAAFAGCSDKPKPAAEAAPATAGNASTAIAVVVNSPRAVHGALPPDGRLIVADAGTGKDDGRILAITPAAGASKDGTLLAEEVQVLMEGLPSRKDGDAVIGAQGAHMSRTGVVCAAIGKAVDAAGASLTGYATVRCTDGRRFDLLKAERELNPDGKGIDSDPYDIFFNGQDSWFVSDRGANTIWRIGPDGSINVQTVFADVAELPKGQAPSPAGLHVTINGRGQALVAVALSGGGIAGFAPGPKDQPIVFAQPGNPTAIWDDGKDTFVLLPGDAPESGRIVNIKGTTPVSGLDRPAGFTRLADGRLVVSEPARRRLRVVAP